MDISINQEELDSLCGLPHMQQLVYIRGIRPYMDIKTQITGLKRGISHQSIAEQLYIEPHPGIKSQSITRAQVRRAIESLERAGLIENQSKDKKLILKCLMASMDYSAQNKVITNCSQKVLTESDDVNPKNTGVLNDYPKNSDAAKSPKVITPLKEDSYIYLFTMFQQFWNLYPEHKSKYKAFEAFQQLNPGKPLFSKIMKGLQAQIDNRKENKAVNNWVPPWKYPANWLSQQCWEDDITPVDIKEKRNASNRKSSQKNACAELFYTPELEEQEPSYDYANNIIDFQSMRQ